MFNKKQKKNVFLIPYYGAKTKDFFKQSSTRYWLKLQELLQGHDVHLNASQLEDVGAKADLLIFQNLYATNARIKRLSSFPKERCMLMAWEPPPVELAPHLPEYQDLFSKVYMLRNDRQDGKHIFHFYYPQDLNPISNTIPFEEKKLITMVCGHKSSSDVSELYSERRRVIEYFEKNRKEDFCFYGTRWEYCGYTNYGGAPKDKLAAIKNYRFCFCYENTRDLPGYITEKIFDCFNAGCVPIYLGAPDISSHIPPNCYIRREDFDGLEELYNHLKAMGEDEHKRYIDAAQQFITSPQAQLFSYDHFAKTFCEGILEMLEN